MVSNINVSVDDDVHQRLYDEKERRGLSWREFLNELSYEVTQEEVITHEQDPNPKQRVRIENPRQGHASRTGSSPTRDCCRRSTA